MLRDIGKYVFGSERFVGERVMYPNIGLNVATDVHCAVNLNWRQRIGHNIIPALGKCHPRPLFPLVNASVTDHAGIRNVENLST